jgi:putative ABC transport system permease protein
MGDNDRHSGALLCATTGIVMRLREIRGWLMRLFGLFHREQREREFVEELESHLAFHIEDNLRAGMSSEEARRQARLKLGGVAQVKELHREQGGIPMLETLLQDLRYGLRMLRKHPSFSLIAIVTLALGIGANTAIFSVVNAVLLRPLPFRESDRLVIIRETKLPQFSEFGVSPGNFLAWQKQNTVFERMVAFGRPSFNLVGVGDPEPIQGMRVTDGFFAMLGAQPHIGRDFLPEEDQPGRSNVVILSHGLWQRRFGADAKILNQTITLNSQNYTVIGVMPESFRFNGDEAIWTPMAFAADQAQNHSGHFLSAVGRLKHGVTLEQANAEMVAIAGRLAAQYPDSNTGWSAKLVPLLEFNVRSIKPALLVLLAAVAFVLLIACVNVANLLLVRAAGRQRELAVRAAMGAGRARIMRQLLTESLLLALLGGAAGALLAKWGMNLLLAFAPQDLPRMSDVSLDGRALGFTAAITLLTGVIFGLLPALRASRPNLQETLKEAARGSTEGGRRQLAVSALVVLEVASALVLLVGAGLLGKSFWQLLRVDPGFNPDHALTLSVALPRTKYPEASQHAAFFRQLLEKVSALPGVQAAGVSNAMPLTNAFVLPFEIEGRPPLPPDASQQTNFYAISPGYLKAMGIPLRQGRYFTERDTQDAPPVAIINETMAQRMFPNENPIGKRLSFGRIPDKYEIVGVVGDVKQDGLDKATPLQAYGSRIGLTFPAMTLVARTAGEPTTMTEAIRNAVLQIDKEQPIARVRTLAQSLSISIAQRQFSMLLLGVFAAVALALAAVGIYGVLSYAVTQRTHEIGIRLAMGAGAREVLILIVGQGMKLALVGIAVGALGALASTRLMSGLLFSVSPTDPWTFASIAALLLAVALLACWLPARRATKVDPLIALRHD